MSAPQLSEEKTTVVGQLRSWGFLPTGRKPASRARSAFVGAAHAVLIAVIVAATGISLLALSALLIAASLLVIGARALLGRRRQRAEAHAGPFGRPER